jgi:alpha-tubulin suppressor-like RCC1 family protein
MRRLRRPRQLPRARGARYSFAPMTKTTTTRRLLLVGLLAACAPEPPAAPVPAGNRQPRPPAPPALVTHALAQHTCALDGLGTASCWGRYDDGQLGGTAGLARVRVASSAPYVMIAVGARHGCALDDAGRVSCWGANDSGQLGTGDSVSRATPDTVASDLRFARISAGAAHTCALDLSGRAFCWGDNRWGQLGDGTRTARTAPVEVRTDASFGRLSAGGRHTCGVAQNGPVLCWGDNFLGQLAQPRDLQNALVPVVVAAIVDAVGVSAGHGHTCALERTGAAWCWGQNGIGQLGSGAPPGSSGPVPVAGTPPLADLRVGYHHTCAVDVDGAGWCWGANTSSDPGDASTTGQLGSEASWSNLPLRIEMQQPLAALAPGDGHTCALTRAGVIYCFGANRYGQLGRLEPARSFEPLRVMRVEGEADSP